MLEMEQNRTTPTTLTVTEPYKTAQFDDYLTYCALAGHITDELGIVQAIPVDEFCRRFNIGKTTIYRWRKMPDFGLKVTQRRLEIVPFARESAAWNRLYMLGMGSTDHKAAVQALTTFLGHFSGLQLPVQRQDIKVPGSLAEVFSNADKEIIEGEVVSNDRPTTSVPNSTTISSEA